MLSGDEMLEILSLGAGVQSSTILLMSCIGELPKLDAAIFADTQWEPPAVYRHLLFLEAQAKVAGIPVYRVTFGNIKEHAINLQVAQKHRTGDSEWQGQSYGAMPFHTRKADGTTGIIRGQCTHRYKVRPIEAKIRELAGVPSRARLKEVLVRQWYGISMDEIGRMRTADKTWIDNYYPLVEMRMDRDDCLQWFNDRGFPEAPKSACVACPFRSKEQWRTIKADPELWAEAVAFDEAIRHPKGLRAEAFVFSGAIPLKDADLRSVSQKEQEGGQMNLFDNDCSGHCGV